MSWFRKKKPSFVEAPMYIQNCVRRAKQIEDICDEHMKKIHPKNRQMDRQVLIPYEDLLKIWDRANLIRNDL